MITAVQIKKIHALKNRLGWSDKQYREYLMSEGDGFAMSCKDLSETEADRLIKKLELAAAAKGVWQLRGASSVERGAWRKYDELGERPGMASPKQLRMIEAMWKDISRYHAEDERARALRSFLFKRFKVSDVKFITSRQASKIIWSLFNMKREGKQQ